jgi:hypothetical protein
LYPGFEYRNAVERRARRSKVGRNSPRPQGAYKLLCLLLYSTHPSLEYMPRRVVRITSLAKLGRYMGTETRNIRKWISYLGNMGYLEHVLYAPNMRSCRLQVRPPHRLD